MGDVKRKLSDIPGFENQIHAFSKFTPYIDSLVDGNLYMNNFQYFIDRELETGDRGVGDKYEVSNHYSDVYLRFYNNLTGELLGEGPADKVYSQKEEDKRRPVYCMFCLHSGNLNVVGEDDDWYYTELDLTKEEKEKMINEFNDQALLINPNPFIERVEKAGKEKGFILAKGLVEYDDFSINSEKRIESYRQQNRIFFWKDHFFKNQHEYRIVVTNTEREVKDPLIFNIGNIDDISYRVNAEQFFQDFQLQIKKRK
ncbi:hypothetical protein CHCC14600_4256 [Bacillus licheniformis]|uniref:hypothetical protein n=1 Tax=Bacillus TaxID=1386 RepID=UPI0011A0011F|nr:MULTISPECIES: hypothetical protein [Bacillus]MCA1182428.1 hypothetical protein [Bacillus licheniformis]TWM95181.1 hypothetical protein CHCC14600_4256 [Bacillus licheniformis]